MTAAALGAHHTSNRVWLHVQRCGPNTNHVQVCMRSIPTHAPPALQTPTHAPFTAALPARQRCACDSDTQVEPSGVTRVLATPVAIQPADTALQQTPTPRRRRESRTKKASSTPPLQQHQTHPAFFYTYLDRAPGNAAWDERASLANPSPPNEDLGLADGGTATKASDPPNEARQTSEVHATAFFMVV